MSASLAFYLARRFFAANPGEKQASRPAVVIAQAGIAIGLAVMIIAVSVVVGFKQQVRGKIVGFAGDIQVTNLEAAGSYETRPISADDSLLTVLESYAQVAHAQRYATKPGIIKTQQDFQGMVLKGVGEEYDLSFLRDHLVEGELPQFSDTATGHCVVISTTLARKLRLHVGDKLDTYFIQQNVRARRLTVVGLYSTNFTEFDQLFLLTDLALVRKLNGWQPTQVSGVEVSLLPKADLESVTYDLAADFEARLDMYGAGYCVRSIEQLHPAIFAWLDILDVNVWVILVLMIGVSGFTMISGLLILILERTSTIGLLKSLGANNTIIRHLFLWLSTFLIGRGMLWGNAIGVGLCLLQQFTGILQLDPATYYMSRVPVSFSVPLWILLNAGTLFVSILMLVGPSHLIARIHPATTMRYE